VTWPFSMTARRSTATTFSPTTMGMPDRAQPMAKESQYLAAIKVEPKAPVMSGSRARIGCSRPNVVSRLTLVNRQSSALSDSVPVRPVAP